MTPAEFDRDRIRAEIASLRQEHDAARRAGDHAIAREAERKAMELMDKLNVGEWGN